jgi:hypothetical protein
MNETIHQIDTLYLEVLMSNLDDAKIKRNLSDEKRTDPLLAKKKAMDKLLFRKRDAVYKFFSNKLSMIFLIILIVGLVFSLYNNISSTIVEIQANELGLNIITALVELVIVFFVPLGFAFVHFGSKKRNEGAIKSGMHYIDQYFGILRLIAIIAGIIISIFLLVSLPWAVFPRILILLLCLVVTIVIVFVLNTFKKFVERVNTEFNREYTSFPDGKKIRTLTVVVCCVYLLYVVGTIVSFAKIDALVEFLPALEDMITIAPITKVFAYIAFVINGAVLGFLLYYVDSYYKFFTKFNEEHKNLIDQKH